MQTTKPRRIAVVPAYNEEPTVAAVLGELYPLVDELVVVDDGSTDRTGAEIARVLAGKSNCQLLVHEHNRGMSEAYATALTRLRERLGAGELDPDDLVFTVDADGQHDLQVLDELVQMTIDEDLDANLARRDMSYHGPFKKTGNWLVSQWASLWAGSPLLDVESGYRIFRLGALAHALDYYSGYKYSETVEVAVVLCRLGYRVRNDHLVPVPVARSRTRMRDALIDVGVIPVAATRVWRRNPARETLATDAVAHFALAGVLGSLVALTYAPRTDTVFTLVLGALAALGLGGVIRRYVPRPSLPVLGALLALAAAWLVPQRPDMGSAIVLAGLFGVGAALAAPAVRRPRPLSLAGACALLVLVRVGGTRGMLLGLAVCAVGAAALAAKFGAIGLPRTHRLRTVTVGTTLVVVTTGLIGYFGASTVGATWFGGGVVHGPRSADEVAITFDGGQDISSAATIMRILDRANVKGTFFIAGKALDAHPQVVRDLYADGHLVGNHSYHHDQWRWLDPRYPELQRTQDAFARDVGACPIWFRPPHGDKTPLMERVVREHGMRMAMWDVSAGKKAADDPDAIAARVLRAVKPGSIIDLNVELSGDDAHGEPVLVDALPQILTGLRARHLQAVRLDTLVGGPAYQSCTRS